MIKGKLAGSKLAASHTADDRLPRYVQIRDDVVRRIGARSWAPGEPLPSEDKLAAEYSVAVGTMRKVLDALALEGIVERVRGRGTFVSRAFERTSMLRFVRFRGAVEGEVPTATIVSISTTQVLPAHAREKLALEPGDKTLYVHRTRSFDGEIVLVEHIFLPLNRFAKLQRFLKEHSPPLLYPVYESECGVLVSRAVDDLTGQTLSALDCKLFGLPPRSSAIQIERTMYEHSGDPVEWRQSYIPIDRFHYSVEIR